MTRVLIAVVLTLGAVMGVRAWKLPPLFFGAKGYGQRQGFLMVPARIAQAGAPFLFGLGVERLTKQTVCKWRVRSVEKRIAGLYDDVCPGKPRTIDDERVAHLIKTTLHTKPSNGPTGACAQWLPRLESPKPACSATSISLGCSRIAVRASRSPPIRSSSRNCVTWLACI